jgi:6-phosphofructokinase 2
LIVTITLNPCIDKSTSVTSLIPEKKLRCAVPKFEPGGGGINVARAIKKLGGNARAIHFAGGYSGKFLQTLLGNEGIESIAIETASHTRENLIVVDESTNSQYRFGMPGSPIKQTEWEACLLQIERMNDVDFIVASGSLSPGIPTDIFEKIAAIAKKIHAKFIVDTSGEALQQAVKEGVYLIKPNLNELAALTGKKLLNKEDIVSESRAIISSGECEIIVVSLGAEGALLVTKDKAVQFIPPAVEKKSTVGAGDSMVAGIVLSLQQNKPAEEAVKFGVACGTAATMNAGTELCKLIDVQKLITEVRQVPTQLHD